MELLRDTVTWRLSVAVATAAIGSAFQHGYNTGVVNAPQLVIEDWLRAVNTERSKLPDSREIDLLWAVAVAVFCAGGAIGGTLVAIIANRWGRRGGLLINTGLVFIAAAMQGSAKEASSYELLIAGRLIIGIHCGLGTGLAPLYLSEIAPVSMRGSVGTLYQLVLTVSILISQILGLESVLGTEKGWPILLGLVVVPAAIQAVLLVMCPESPRYLLVNRGMELEAEQALSWFRGTIEVHAEMVEMKQEADRLKVRQSVSLKGLLTRSSLRQPLIISLMVMISQQLSGINVVIFYSTMIFEHCNLEGLYAQYATIGMGSMNVLMTIVSVFLVERLGRRSLLLSGFAGMLIDTLALSVALHYVTKVWVSYLSIALVIIFVMMFAIGPGPIPWFLVTELFDQTSRPAASAAAVTINWVFNFIISLGFLSVQAALGPYVFIIFAALQLIFLIFIHFKVPETKNKTIEEITTLFRHQEY